MVWACCCCYCCRSPLIVGDQLSRNFLFINEEIQLYPNRSSKSLKTTKLTYQRYKADESRRSGLAVTVNLNFVVCTVVSSLRLVSYTLRLLPRLWAYVLCVPCLVSCLCVSCAFRLLPRLWPCVLCVSRLISRLVSCALRLSPCLSPVGFPFLFKCNRSTRFFALHYKS